MGTLAADSVRRYVEALLAACQQDSFQERVAAMRAKGGVTFNLGVAKLMNEACGPASSEAGLEQKLTVQQLKEQLSQAPALKSDHRISSSCLQIERLIHMKPAQLFGIEEVGTDVPSGASAVTSAPAVQVETETRPPPAPTRVDGASTPGSSKFSLEVAKQFLQAVEVSCGEDGYQQKIAAMSAKGGITFNLGVAKLMTEVCGAACDQVGMPEKLPLAKVKEQLQVDELSQDADIRRRCLAIEKLVRFKPGQLFGLKEDASAGAQSTAEPPPSVSAAASPPAAAGSAGQQPEAPAGQETVQLLMAFEAECRKAEFQETLGKLKSGITYQLGLAKLMLRATTAATAECNLGEGWTVQKVKELVQRDGQHNLQVRSKAQSIEKLLKVNVGTIFGWKEEAGDTERIAEAQQPVPAAAATSPAAPQQQVVSASPPEAAPAASLLAAQGQGSAAPATTASRALLLLEAFEVECSKEDFQDTLAKLKSGISYQLGLAKLMSRATVAAASSCDLGEGWTMAKVKEFVRQQGEDDPKVRAKAQAVEKLLKVNVGSIFGWKEDSSEQQARPPTAADAQGQSQPSQDEKQKVSALLDAFQQHVSAPEFQKDVKSLQQRGGITLQLGLVPLVNKAAKAAAEAQGDVSENFNLRRLADMVKEQAADPTIRTKALEAERAVGGKMNMFGLQDAKDSQQTAAPTKALPRGPQLATQLLAAFVDECNKPAFQQDLGTLCSRGGVTFQLGFAQLQSKCLTAAANQCGFGSDWTMQKFKELVKEQADVPEVRKLAASAEQLLRTNAGALFGLKDASEAAPTPPSSAASAPKLDIKVGADGIPQLTDKQAVALQDELIEAYSAPDFQSQLKAIEETHKRDTVPWTRARNKLLSPVQAKVLPKYGFEPNARGAFMMVQVIGSFLTNKEIEKRGDKLQELLLLPTMRSSLSAADNFQPEEKAASKEEEEEVQQPEVEVSLQHAVTKEEVVVTIAGNSTMKDVKEALSAKLGRPDILKQARLAKKLGTSFSSLKESDRVEGRKLLYVVGVDDLQAAKGVEAAPATETKPQQLESSPHVEAPTTKEAKETSPPAQETSAKVKEVVDLPETDVEVKVRHVFNDQEVTVVVLSSSTFKDVKEAVAAQLGRPEIAKIGRLVQKAGASFSSFANSEKIGGRRKMLIIGPDDLNPAPGHSAEPAAKKATPVAGVVVVDSGGGRKLTVEEGLALQRELMAGYAKDDFQSKLQDAFTMGRSKVAPARRELALSVQKEVLPKYGFPGTPGGAMEMMMVLGKPEFMANMEFQVQGAELNRLLLLDAQGRPLEASQPAGTPAVAAASSPEGDASAEASRAAVAAAPPAAAETEAETPSVPEVPVDVVVRHAMTEEEMQLSVLKTMTLKEVREVLAEQLGREDIKKSARIVLKQGAGFAAIPLTEKVGTRRKLLVIGVDDLRPAPGKEQQQQQQKQDAVQPQPAETKAEEPSYPTMEQVKGLLEEMVVCFGADDFQRRLRDIASSHRGSTLAFNKEKTKLLLEVQKEVLPKYGFEGSPKGVYIMSQVVGYFTTQNAEINFLADETQRLCTPPVVSTQAAGEPALEAAAPKTEESQPEKDEAPAEDVEVTVKHALTDEEVPVVVNGRALIKEVKDALSQKLGREDIAKSGRLVARGGGSYMTLSPNEKLGSRRKVLIMGVDDLKSALPLAKVESKPRAEDTAKPQQRSGKLTLEEGLALQRELLARFSEAKFQENLAEARQQGWSQLTSARKEMVLAVQAEVLPKYGLEGSQKGVMEMMGQFLTPLFTNSPEFGMLGFEINGLLMLDERGRPIETSLAKTAAAEKDMTPEKVNSKQEDGSVNEEPEEQGEVVDVEVKIKHAITAEEVAVVVKSSAVMKDVKEAVSKLLGRPDIAKTARLVQKLGGGGFGSISNTDKLGARRRVLIMGIDDLQAGKDVEASKPPAPASQPGGVRLTLENAIALQKELLEGFQAADVQGKLIEAARQGKSKLAGARMQLAFSVQKVVLPKYGFEASLVGIGAMMQEFSLPHLQDDECNALGVELNRLLLLDPVGNPIDLHEIEGSKGENVGSTSAASVLQDASPPEVSQPEVTDVEVKVKHVLTDEEAIVTVKSNATVKDVKEALAGKLGRPDILKSARIVITANSGFTTIPPSELLQSRRKLLVIGVEDLLPAVGASSAEAAAAKTSAAETKKLTLEEGIAMQLQLKAGFEQPEFQEKLLAAAKAGRQELSKARKELAYAVQQDVLPKYGFQGTHKGVMEMMSQLMQPLFVTSSDFLVLGGEINRLLLLDQSGKPLESVLSDDDIQRLLNGQVPEANQTKQTEESAADAEKEPSEDDNTEVEVKIKHALNEEEEATIQVKASATMKEVKEALAEALGREEIVKTARLVQKSGKTFSSYSSSEKLGPRRKLFIVGVDDLRPKHGGGQQKPGAPGTAALTLEQGLALQRELMAGFAKESFQSKLAEAAAKSRSELSKARSALALEVQQKVLPKFGLEGSAAGVMRMLDQFNSPTFQSSQEFGLQGAELNRLLLLDEWGRPIDVTPQSPAKDGTKQVEAEEAAQNGAAQAQAVPEAEEMDDGAPDVDVTVKHAVTNEEVSLRVPANSTIKDIKEALATKLGREDVAKSGKVVLKSGGAGYASISATEKLGPRRKLLFMGVEDMKAAPGAELKAAMELTEDTTARMLEDFIARYDEETFQNKLKEAYATHGLSTAFAKERGKLILEVQKVVLPKYGFEGSAKGAFLMSQAIGRFSDQEHIQRLIYISQVKAGIIEGAESAAPATTEAKQEAAGPAEEAEKPAEAVTDVEVKVKHAMTDQEVIVNVKSSSTMKDVKEALAEQLGRTDLAKAAKLVQKAGTSFSSFANTEKIGARRRLLLIGVDNLDAATGAAPQKPSTSTAPGKGSGERVKLTLEQGLALQRELLAAFAEEDFQTQMQGAFKQGRSKITAVRRDLAFAVQKEVLPKFGLPGTHAGVMDMMMQFGEPEFVMDPRFQVQGGELNRLLLMDGQGRPLELSQQGADAADESSVEAGASNKVRKAADAAEAAALPSEEATPTEIVVRHALTDEEVKLTVPSTAALQEVRTILGDHLGRDDVKKSARMVNKQGGQFTTIPLTERLGNRRKLLVIGIDDLHAKREEPVQRAEEQKEDVIQPVIPSLDDVKNLLQELVDSFSGEDFQRRLSDCADTHGLNTAAFGKERNKMILEVQKAIIPKYGFEASHKGVFFMSQAVGAYSQEHADVAKLADDAQRLSGVQSDTQPAAPSKVDIEETPAAPQGEDVVDDNIVEVKVKHAVRGDEVSVYVKSSATMKDVKEALSKQLSRPDIEKSARLVQRSGAGFSSHSLTEKLGSRRRVLIIGVEDLKPGEGFVDRPSSVTRRPDGVPLSLEEAVSLQKELYAGFSAESFQAKLKEAAQQGRSKLARLRFELAFSVQRDVLPKYGFEASPAGVQLMMQQFALPHLQVEEPAALGAELNRLLLLDPFGNPIDIPSESSEKAPDKSGSAEAEAESTEAAAVDVEVKIKHAIADDEVTIIAQSDATMKQVIKALASQLGREDIARDARVVTRGSGAGGGFKSVPMTEQLRARRSLLVIGVENLVPATGSSTKSAPKAAAAPAEGEARGEVLELALDQGIALQEELKAGFQQPDFQQSLLAEAVLGRVALSKARKELVFKVQCELLPKYGFEASPKGVLDMMTQFSKPHFLMNSGFALVGSEINELLLLNEAGRPVEMVLSDEDFQRKLTDRGAPAKDATQTLEEENLIEDDHLVQEVEVTLKHALTNEEVMVRVPSTATMKKVKEALAEKLGREDVTKSGKLVAKSGAAGFSSIPGTEKLGSRRKVLVMGVDDLKPSPGKEHKDLSEEEAARMLDDFIAKYKEETYQQSLRAAFADHGGKTSAFAKERTRLIQEVQKDILPRYGFPANAKGAFEMSQALSKFPDNEKIQRLIYESQVHAGVIEHEGQGQDAEAPPPAVTAEDAEAQQEPMIQEPEPPAEPVDVVVKHAVTDEEVSVSVPATCSMLDIKEALAAKLGREDLQKSLRIVQKVGGGFSALSNAEKIGARRKLLAIGVDNLKPAAAAAAPVAKASKTAPTPTLTLAQALNLQRDLLDGFRKEGVQQKLHDAFAQDRSTVKTSRRDLAFVVQKEVLPKYGFEASRAGVVTMMGLFMSPEYQSSPDFNAQGAELNELLCLTPEGRPLEDILPDDAGSSTQPLEEAAHEEIATEAAMPDVDVTVKHAVTEEEALVFVPGNATIQDVKEKLGKSLERSDIPKALRVVSRSSTGGFATIANTDKIGSRRKLLVIGVESLHTSSGLTLEQGLALQQVLIKEYSKASFQRQLNDAAAKGDKELAKVRLKLVLDVQPKVLPLFGLQGDGMGMRKMLSEFDEAKFQLSEIFQLQGDKLNTLLKQGGPIPQRSEEVAMSRDGVLKLLSDLNDAYSQEEFQKRLQELLDRHSGTAAELADARQKLLLSAQSKVLKEHGFDQDGQGVNTMLQVVASHSDDADVVASLASAGAKLGLDVQENAAASPSASSSRAQIIAKEGGSEPAPSPPPPAPTEPESAASTPAEVSEAGEMVQLVVKHALKPADQVTLTVSTSSTIRQVREALAEHLGREDILKSVRLVKKSGGSFLSLPEKDTLGTRTSIMALGTDRLNPGS